MIYFDNAATSFPKPEKVKEAVNEALNCFGNPSRGAHDFALNATRTVEYARARVAGFFGCRKAERTVFTKNVTEALNIAIASIEGHIVTSQAEHNSVLRPVYRGNNYTVVEIDSLGRYESGDILKALRPDTAAVVLAHASNLTGYLNPLEEVGRICRERNIFFIVDAAQTAGLIDIDMDKLGSDALCFTGHKSLLGPQGTGGLCLSERFTPRPLLVGGSGERTFETLQPPELPILFEAGTLNSHGLAGLLAGLEYVMEKSPGKLLSAACSVADFFYSHLKDMKKVIFYGDYSQKRRLPIVAINVGNRDSEETALILAEEYDIAVRAGAHCAPLLHQAFGTAKRGSVRFSFSHWNTMEEAAIAVKAIKAIVKM